MKFRSRSEIAPSIAEHGVTDLGLGLCFGSLERKWSATQFSSGIIPKFVWIHGFGLDQLVVTIVSESTREEEKITQWHKFSSSWKKYI